MDLDVEEFLKFMKVSMLIDWVYTTFSMSVDEGMQYLIK